MREQIIEKERKKKQQRELILQEGQDLRNRMQKREKIIKEAIKKKIDQIRYFWYNFSHQFHFQFIFFHFSFWLYRSSDIPEIYVKKLEQHMNVD